MKTSAPKFAVHRAMTISLAVVYGSPAMAEGFDTATAGTQPPGWSCGVTGRGTPSWAVKADPEAPSPPNVLLQSGHGDFPWCIKNGATLADGFVVAKFKPISGKEDQAGGLVWRWKDKDHYYVARANALENNVSLYYVEGGKRRNLKYVDARVPQGQWSTLRVEFSAQRIRVVLNDQRLIEFDDAHISGAGKVGVWTKADSVTAFDDFSFGETRGPR